MRSGAAAAKAEARARHLAARERLGPRVRAAASAAVCARLARLPELRDPAAVFAYAAISTEVDVDAFLAEVLARGQALYLPLVRGPSLEAHRVRDLSADVQAGYRGVREPLPAGPPADLATLGAAVVPGVAFDGRGTRLGYGGGHFDRLLARWPPGMPVVGVAFEAQLAVMLPREPHDRPVDLVVTERRLLRP